MVRKISDGTHAKLRLVSDEYGRGARLGTLRVVVASADKPPFPVAAQVCEEDTFLVLSAATTVREPSGDLATIAAELHTWKPRRPGSIAVYPGDPPRLLAVVHDLDRDPSWCDEWVLLATRAALDEADRRGLESLSMPLLGTRHGGLEPLRFASLLTDAAHDFTPTRLRAIWLISPPGIEYALAAVLRHGANTPRLRK